MRKYKNNGNKSTLKFSDRINLISSVEDLRPAVGKQECVKQKTRKSYTLSIEISYTDQNMKRYPESTQRIEKVVKDSAQEKFKTKTLLELSKECIKKDCNDLIYFA